jgi:hypothetical protein
VTLTGAMTPDYGCRPVKAGVLRAAEWIVPKIKLC